MKCPACEIDLEPNLIGPIEIDECSRCGGAWFEDDELRQAKDSCDVDLNWMDFELWKDWNSLDLKPTDLACPKCKQRLIAVRYADTVIEIDCCPKCKGTWLEKGEFASIIDSLTDELLNKPSSKYITASLQEAKEIVTGPESLWSQWKDFTTVLRLMQYRLLSENPTLSKTLARLQAASPF